MREGSDPLALSRGAAIRGFCFFRFFSQTRSRGCERVPTLSRSPMGTAIRGSCFFRFFSRTRSRGMREGSDPLALSRGAAIRGSYFFCFFEQTRSRGCDSRLLLLLFLRTDSPPRMREGSDPLALSRGGRDSRLSTSFTSPFVSPYSSGMRTVSDWGGTVTAVDSFLGCAESRFAERKSVWVTASGRVTRMSRSAERLYTR